MVPLDPLAYARAVPSIHEALRKRLNVEQLYRNPIGPVVAAHVGPGCVAMAACPVSAMH